MEARNRLLRVYFDRVYNRVYDFTTARLTRYRKLQETCISKLDFSDHDKILCLGVGTGNEIMHILSTNDNVQIVGVDYSGKALQKARQKILKQGKEIETHIMDVQRLDFPAESFDKVLCIHVMDWVDDNHQATGELFRVLKAGGQFVITYPSDKEGAKLGYNLMKDMIRTNSDSGKHPAQAFFVTAAQMITMLVYVPLISRPHKKSYSRQELEKMIRQAEGGGIQIDEDVVYQDFIVYGSKETKGGKVHAIRR